MKSFTRLFSSINGQERKAGFDGFEKGSFPESEIDTLEGSLESIFRESEQEDLVDGCKPQNRREQYPATS